MGVLDKSTNPKTLGRVTFNEAGSISPGPILKGNVALLYNQLCCKSKSVQPTRHSHINDGQDSNKCVANDNNQSQLSHNNVALFLRVVDNISDLFSQSLLAAVALAAPYVAQNPFHAVQRANLVSSVEAIAACCCCCL